MTWRMNLVGLVLIGATDVVHRVSLVKKPLASWLVVNSNACWMRTDPIAVWQVGNALIVLIVDPKLVLGALLIGPEEFFDCCPNAAHLVC